MEIRFVLAWAAPTVGPKSFGSAGSHALFTEYLRRIGRFVPSKAVPPPKTRPKTAASRIWLCDRSPGSRVLGSEDLAAELGRALSGAVRELDIVIGGPDGFSQAERQALAPALRWSFGPLTLPHELAAVVAAEQVYRAFCILRRLPYHAGH